jgi:hypothetical protein
MGSLLLWEGGPMKLVLFGVGMQMFVKTLTGKTITIDMLSNETVEFLHLKIFLREGNNSRPNLNKIHTNKNTKTKKETVDEQTNKQIKQNYKNK